jgi:UDP-GlcNAc:undecaprenyl-phosphate/decaprenyl-phosphate GlcNAc-1-phosphate transferase
VACSTFLCLALLPYPDADPALYAIIAGAGLLFVMGLADDKFTLPPLPRFAVQVAVAASLAWAYPDCRLPFSNAAISIPLSILFLVTMTNAFNFLDNMDGLSAGIAAIALTLIGGLNLLVGTEQAAWLALVGAGAVLGFLFFNFPPASIFMGDAGSFFIGFLTSALCLWTCNHIPPSQVGSAAAPFFVLIIPAYDIVAVILIRLRRGIAPWQGDHNHISHRLVRLGLSRRGAVLAIYAMVLVFGIFGLLLIDARLLPPAALWSGSLGLAALTALADFSTRHRSLAT